jgi:hypothetical protein
LGSHRPFVRMCLVAVGVPSHIVRQEQDLIRAGAIFWSRIKMFSIRSNIHNMKLRVQKNIWPNANVPTKPQLPSRIADARSHVVKTLTNYRVEIRTKVHIERFSVGSSRSQSFSISADTNEGVRYGMNIDLRLCLSNLFQCRTSLRTDIVAPRGIISGRSGRKFREERGKW